MGGAVSYPQLCDKGSPSFELPFYLYLAVTIFLETYFCILF